MATDQVRQLRVQWTEAREQLAVARKHADDSEDARLAVQAARRRERELLREVLRAIGESLADIRAQVVQFEEQERRRAEQRETLIAGRRRRKLEVIIGRFRVWIAVTTVPLTETGDPGSRSASPAGGS